MSLLLLLRSLVAESGKVLGVGKLLEDAQGVGEVVGLLKEINRRGGNLMEIDSNPNCLILPG